MNTLNVRRMTLREILRVGKRLYTLGEAGMAVFGIDARITFLLDPEHEDKLDKTYMVTGDGWTVYVFDDEIIAVSPPKEEDLMKYA